MEPYIRRGDGLILVCQDNQEKSLTIKEVNPILCDIIGYDEKSLVEQSLLTVLAKRLKDSLEDYLEYDDDAHDMQAVLSRVSGFKLLHKDGHDVDVVCKIVRSTAYDRHHWFRLIIKDEVQRREEDTRRTSLVEQFKAQEQMDLDVGIANAASLEKDLDVVLGYVSSNALEAVYATIRLDDYAQLRQHDTVLAHDAMKHVAANIRRSLRADDAICRASEDSIGIILTDISIESARVVLNRLRWSIISDKLMVKGMPSRSIGISIAYQALSADGSSSPITTCADALNAINTPNAMLEL
jgi:GGDEF domain-containing protein